MNSQNQRRRFRIAGLLLAMTVCNVILLVRLIPSLRNGFQDFTIYYTSGLLLRSGQASSLYDLATQYQVQLKFAHVPIRQAALPFNHPAFEALLFIPFTWLNYGPAYLVWSALNVIMLTVSITVLSRHFHWLAGIPRPLLGLAATAFFPVANGLIQGQDVILLLLLLVLAVISLDKGNDAMAGALLGAGLFRPHLIVPLVALLAIRRWRVLLGFAPVALVLGGIIVAIMGWRGPFDYVRFVINLEKTGVLGFGPEATPNIRSLVMSLPGPNVSGPWIALIIAAFSVVVFFVALRRIRNGPDSAIYMSSLAVLTTILISFHVLVHDLTLLLPMLFFLLSRMIAAKGKTMGAAVFLPVFLLFLSPLYFFLLLVVDRFFWFSLILLWLYVWLLRNPVLEEVPALS
jgi:Glycosyltransferase family 87